MRHDLLEFQVGFSPKVDSGRWHTWSALSRGQLLLVVGLQQRCQRYATNLHTEGTVQVGKQIQMPSSTYDEPANSSTVQSHLLEPESGLISNCTNRPTGIFHYSFSSLEEERNNHHLSPSNSLRAALVPSQWRGSRSSCGAQGSLPLLQE